MFVRETEGEIPYKCVIFEFSLRPRKEILFFLCEVPMCTSDTELSVENSVKQLRLNPCLLGADSKDKEHNKV